MLHRLIIFIASAFVYFYFNWQYLSFLDSYFETSGQTQRFKKLYKSIVFAVNYTVFIVCTLLQLHLILNWSVFFLFLFWEVHLLYRQPRMSSVCCALFGVMTGLALNIIFRCSFALVLDKPLEVFDNQAFNTENLKAYPVIFGFAASGLSFYLFQKMKLGNRSRILLQSPQSIHFLACIQIVLYVFLLLNLLPYSSKDNNPIMKLWGMKSALFVLIGLYLAGFYSVRMGQLGQFEQKNKQEREELLKERHEEERIRIIAFTDPLTGCYNRQYADFALEELWNQGMSFSIVFADLNGLKKINDIHGHLEGDRYLKKTVQNLRKIIRGEDLLTRYGGDEFLVIFPGLEPNDLRMKMEQVNQGLSDWKTERGYQCTVSISYGIASREETEEIKSLLKLADERMYQDKKRRMQGYTA